MAESLKKLSAICLENVIECAMILSHEPILRIDRHTLGSQDSSFTASLPAGLNNLERWHILQTLALTN